MIAKDLKQELHGFLANDCLDLHDVSTRIGEVAEIAEICRKSLINLMIQFESLSQMQGKLPEEACAERQKIIDKIATTAAVN